MERESRPKVLPGNTEKIVTGCGNMYVILNDKDEQPFEVFAELGRSGSCMKCQCEAITRLISTGLQHGVPLEEYIDQLAGLRCSNPVIAPKQNRVLSCPDAVSKAIASLTGKQRKGA